MIRILNENTKLIKDVKKKYDENVGVNKFVEFEIAEESKNDITDLMMAYLFKGKE